MYCHACSELQSRDALISQLQEAVVAAERDSALKLSQLQDSFLNKMEQLRRLHQQQLEKAEGQAKVRQPVWHSSKRNNLLQGMFAFWCSVLYLLCVMLQYAATVAVRHMSID